MDFDTIAYVFDYFGGLMTENESKAWRHYSSNFKLTHGGKKLPNEAMKKVYFEKGWISTDPEVLKLLNNGIDAFKRDAVNRILKETPDKVYFNKCPNCQKLARTPRAKQCRFCGHDWHLNSKES